MSNAIPFGRVILDATPVEVPTRLKMPASRAEQIREFIRHELSLQAAAQGHETFEEADDFSIDETEPLTPYELMMLDGEIQPLVEKILASRQSPPVDSGGVADKTAPPSGAAPSPQSSDTPND